MLSSNWTISLFLILKHFLPLNHKLTLIILAYLNNLVEQMALIVMM